MGRICLFDIRLFIDLFESQSYDAIESRNDRFEDMLFDAISNPTANLRNIYFGLLMGISACIPTCIHISMFLRAVYVNKR